VYGGGGSFVRAAAAWNSLRDSLKDSTLPLSCLQDHLTTFCLVPLHSARLEVVRLGDAALYKSTIYLLYFTLQR